MWIKVLRKFSVLGLLVSCVFFAISCEDKNLELKVEKKHIYKGTHENTTVVDQVIKKAPNGDFVVVFMTGGAYEPEVNNYIAMVRSKDGGKTWGKRKVVLRLENEGSLPTELVVHKKTMTIHGVRHDGKWGHWKNFTMISHDSGKTWGEPAPFAPLPNRVFIRNLLILKNGTWVLPYQSYANNMELEKSHLKDGTFRAAYNGVLISKDEGKTWVKNKKEVGPNKGWLENNVIELSSGKLMMLIRGDGLGYLLKSESTDGGMTWSKSTNSGIDDPGSKFRLLSYGDKIVFIHNDSKVRGAKGRTNLSIWASKDDMKSWYFKQIVADFPGRIQYPDGDLVGDDLHFVFDYERHDLIYFKTNLRVL